MRTEKRCPTCTETHQGNLFLVFYKSNRSSDGLDWHCKKCHNSRSNGQAQARRDKRRLAKDKLKVGARSAARRVYNTDEHKCAVIDCLLTAEELHHVNYEKALDVVPLCRAHHDDWHESK